MRETITRPQPPAFSIRRIGAMVRRYWYLLRGSWPRIVELAYWPTVQMIMWGFLTQHLRGDSAWVTQAAGVLISGVLLWDVLFRGQLGYTLSFLEEMYSRNLGQLFVTPLRPVELVLAMMTISMLRTLIGRNVFGIGLPLAAFFVNLMVMGWAVGMAVTAMLLRVGLGGESLAWLVIFVLLPVSAVYYPVAVLPAWLQAVAWALPPAYVFEGMRAVLFDGIMRWDLLAGAVALNLVYLVFGAALFLWSFRVARKHGLLLNSGE